MLTSASLPNLSPKLPAWHRTPPQQGSPQNHPAGPSWKNEDSETKTFSEKAMGLYKPWGHLIIFTIIKTMGKPWETHWNPWKPIGNPWETHGFSHGFPPWDQGTERYLSASRAAMAPEPAEVMAWWWNELSPRTERRQGRHHDMVEIPSGKWDFMVV